MLKMIFVWKSLHWKCLLILQHLEWGRGEGEASIQPSGRWAYSKLRQSPSTCNKDIYLHTWGGMRGRIEQDNKLNLCQKVNKFFLRSFQPFSKGCGPYCLVWGKWKVKKVCRLGLLYKIFAEETNTKNNEKWFSVLKMRSDMHLFQAKISKS